MDASSPPPSSAIGRTVLGSILSALAGWVALTMVLVGVYLVRTDEYAGNDFWSVLTLPICAGFFIVPVWLVALLPLYCFVPSRSTLWWWPVCTLCGATAGGAIMLAFCVLLTSLLADGLPLVGLAALVGAATCLFGSVTRRWFHRP